MSNRLGKCLEGLGNWTALRGWAFPLQVPSSSSIQPKGGLSVATSPASTQTRPHQQQRCEIEEGRGRTFTNIPRTKQLFFVDSKNAEEGEAEMGEGKCKS
jgi:hypothetical protein